MQKHPSIGVNLFIILLSGFALLQAQFPKVPPPNVTSKMDRDQMLWQLGIELPHLPPKTTDPNRPRHSVPVNPDDPEGNWTDAAGHIITRSVFGLWNNYDDVAAGFFPGPESWRVGKYIPIDLLKMNDGTLIENCEQWWQLRRPELLRDVQKQIWGVPPPDSILPPVSWKVTKNASCGSYIPYIEKYIEGNIDITHYPQVRNVPKISAVLRIPAGQSGAVPVMVVIGHPLLTKTDRYWEYVKSSGWGVCIFNSDALQPDNGTGLTSYIIGLCNQGRWRSPSDWGTLAAWAWGVSRLIDYFETDNQVDACMIGVTGHSRYGKAALVAMAYDTRLAISFPSCAGSLGTKMNRRHWGQDLENSVWEREYHWVAGNFIKWSGPLSVDSYLPRNIEKCRVDAHSLLALCAPRPVFINAGSEDAWTDPYGIFLTCINATPAYELLGKKGLVMNDKKPRLNTAYLEGNIAFRYHDGGHTDAPDWPAFFRFAKRFYP
ncbi:MAG: acetylxylan esterase [Fidelibacterota bacterium]